VLAGEVNAAAISGALAPWSTVANRKVRVLNTSDVVGNRALIEQDILSIQNQIRDGDTFVMYIGTHGYLDDTDDPSRPLINADHECQYVNNNWQCQTRPSRGRVRLYLANTIGDSDENIADNEFAGLFRNSWWEHVDKVFIIDACFSGGFWTELQTLPGGNSSIIAAAQPGKIGFASCVRNCDTSVGTFSGVLGQSVVSALNAQANRTVIAYNELLAAVSQSASYYNTLEGRVNTDPRDNFGTKGAIQFVASESRAANFGTGYFRTCLPDFNANGVVNIDDIFIYLNAWFASDPRCDVSGNSLVNIDDIFIYLNLWFAGC
jgi:hypothetical protein